MRVLREAASPLLFVLALAASLPEAAGPMEGALQAVDVRADALARDRSSSNLVGDERRWLSAISLCQDDPILGTWSERVFTTSEGRKYVPLAIERAQIMALRNSSRHVARATFWQALAARRNLEHSFGRRVGVHDLIVAHRLGVDDASSLLQLAERSPDGNAAEHLPRMALKEPDLFFAKGRSLSARGVVYRIAGQPSGHDWRTTLDVTSPSSMAGTLAMAAQAWSAFREMARLAVEGPPPWQTTVAQIAPSAVTTHQRRTTSVMIEKSVSFCCDDPDRTSRSESH